MSIPQSLPSFAQAFSSSSLSDIAHISNALPPIQPTKKRPRTDRADPDAYVPDRLLSLSSPPKRVLPSHSPDPSRPDPRVRVKQEDRDDPARASMSPADHPDTPRDDDPAPAPLPPLSKKRRVTLSAIPNPVPAEQPTPVPISPALPSPADDSVPRTGSHRVSPKTTFVDQRCDPPVLPAAGPAPMVSGSLLSASPPGDQLATSKLARIGRISPTTVPVATRCAGNAAASSSSARPMTPPPPSLVVSAPQPPALTAPEPPPKPQPVAATHSLPPPPISFARRRAAQPGARKKKPADILISPRGAGPSDPLAPVIQSAPPVPDPGRFPMAIPRLPLVMSNTQQPTRRVAGNVPPTPTRFSLHGTAPAPSISSTARTMHSPPTNPSVPIANNNTLVPPTPHALKHPGYSSDKTAFLAPFEAFYDALNDSKQLKGWLSEQLQKSNALMMSLKQQQDKMDEIVEDLVEKRARAMREEITMLRQRMESLEEALLAVRAESSPRGQDGGAAGYKVHHQNGVVTTASEPTSSYRFPAASEQQRRAEATIRVTSPEREREQRPSVTPPVEVTRRPSVSAARTEVPQGMHGSYGLGGGHNRSTSNSGKGTPVARPQGVPERTPSGRTAETRTATRLWSYGNSSPAVVDGTASSSSSSRGGEK